MHTLLLLRDANEIRLGQRDGLPKSSEDAVLALNRLARRLLYLRGEELDDTGEELGGEASQRLCAEVSTKSSGGAQSKDDRRAAISLSVCCAALCKL